nr:immunoglobulin light chain junction region [Macaca mulatta]MOX08186.1 immunoglobulin light chain junction region [Macaca mulatta]
YMQALDFPLTF